MKKRSIYQYGSIINGGSDAEIGHLEGIGALNFLALDDLPVSAEGEPLDPHSIIPIDVKDGQPVC